MSGQGTRFPNGLKDSTGTKITSNLSTITKTSAAADADKVALDADVTDLFAEMAKIKTLIERLLG